MKVVVLTTSYPRHPGDIAGSFIAAGVEQLRARGLEVEVVSPATFRHFGIAYGDGIVNNLRRAPLKVLLIPAFLVSFAIAARRAARDADLVHAHWLPSAVPALAAGRPFVLQLWGTDAHFARRIGPLAGWLMRRARILVCASTALQAEASRSGARDVRVIPAGVDIPADPGVPDEPPHLLYVGRLSEEKGVRILEQAARGLDLRVVGDGPLRDLFPQAEGFAPPGEVAARYRRAAIVVVPSLREGYGLAAREAMAHGRLVVSTNAGGLADAIDDGVTGLVVPPGDALALRAALQRALADAGLRSRLGGAAREHASKAFSHDIAAARTMAAYHDACRN